MAKKTRMVTRGKSPRYAPSAKFQPVQIILAKPLHFCILLFIQIIYPSVPDPTCR